MEISNFFWVMKQNLLLNLQQHQNEVLSFCKHRGLLQTLNPLLPTLHVMRHNKITFNVLYALFHQGLLMMFNWLLLQIYS